jgi:raffinose/stachyose/melibiose transport system substrate-binding protein
MVNANSPNIDLAVEFLALLNSPENVQKFISEADTTPLALSAAPDEQDGRSAGLQTLLNDAPAIVLPPDTGYDIPTALELYAAEAAVLGGQQTPAEALAALDERLGR